MKLDNVNAVQKITYLSDEYTTSSDSESRTDEITDSKMTLWSQEHSIANRSQSLKKLDSFTASILDGNEHVLFYLGSGADIMNLLMGDS